MNDREFIAKKSLLSWKERLRNFFLLRKLRNREQFALLLHTAKEHHLLNPDALTMMEGVLKVLEMKARDIMVARAQMITLEYDATPQTALPIIIESTHSRFPVIGENRGKVVGILLAKDLLPYLTSEQSANIQIKDIVRPAAFIPESKRLDILLREFRLNRNHMAIVIDEYDSVSGLITIEDVLEQIVGSIEDETDIAETDFYIKKINDKEYNINALTPIAIFNQYFQTELSEEDFDTIGGYVIQIFGHVPKPGETTMLSEFKVHVVLASKRRIQSLRFIRVIAQST